MFGIRKKTKLLRAIGTDTDCQETSCNQERIAYSDFAEGEHQDYWKVQKAALLDAERMEAQALMQWQQRRPIY